jgi:hypothetical protein
MKSVFTEDMNSPETLAEAQDTLLLEASFIVQDDLVPPDRNTTVYSVPVSSWTISQR